MILLTGANGVVGKPLGDYLSECDISFMKVTRSVSNCKPQTIQWDLACSISKSIKQQLNVVDTLIHCAPIWLLPIHMQDLLNAGLCRLVVFSSTSVISKQKSTSVEEQSLVNQLKNAEQELNLFCQQNEVVLTILRPSMIYGYGRDQNVMQIAGFIKRFGCMILAGKADGLRQPVHSEDLVKAVIDVLDNKHCYAKTYNLAGGETLSYYNMVERIFLGLGKKPIIISIPIPLYRLALRLAAMVTSFSYTAEMATRMSQNLIYNYSEAINDFSYQPQKFLVQPKRDLEASDEHN